MHASMHEFYACDSQGDLCISTVSRECTIPCGDHPAQEEISVQGSFQKLAAGWGHVGPLTGLARVGTGVPGHSRELSMTVAAASLWRPGSVA